MEEDVDMYLTDVTSLNGAIDIDIEKGNHIEERKSIEEEIKGLSG